MQIFFKCSKKRGIIKFQVGILYDLFHLVRFFNDKTFFLKSFLPQGFQSGQFFYVLSCSFFVKNIPVVFKNILNFVPNCWIVTRVSAIWKSSFDHNFFPLFSIRIFFDLFPLLKLVLLSFDGFVSVKYFFLIYDL